MTQETLNKIRNEYLEAFNDGTNVLSILKAFYRRLDVLELPAEDHDQFDLFLSGLDTEICNRKKTIIYSNLTVCIVHTIFYIVIFMNHKKGMTWDTNIISRRKSLKRELTKILKKATTSSDVAISDLFGVRVVSQNHLILNDKDEISELHNIDNVLKGILCNTNRQLKKEFSEFLSNLDDPLLKEDPSIPSLVSFTLEHVKMKIAEGSCKNYLDSPKDNGYKSLHFVLEVDFSSLCYSGARIEVQIRSQKMDEDAEYGEEHGHQDYEDLTPKEIREVFEIPDSIPKSNRIPGFHLIEKEITDANGKSLRVDRHFVDTDGINFGKQISTRRASKSVIPIN